MFIHLSTEIGTLQWHTHSIPSREQEEKLFTKPFSRQHFLKSVGNIFGQLRHIKKKLTGSQLVDSLIP